MKGIYCPRCKQETVIISGDTETCESPTCDYEYSLQEGIDWTEDADDD